MNRSIAAFALLIGVPGLAFADDTARASLRGNEFLAGGYVELSDRVTRNAFVSGGDVLVDGFVGRNLYRRWRRCAARGSGGWGRTHGGRNPAGLARGPDRRRCHAGRRIDRHGRLHCGGPARLWRTDRRQRKRRWRRRIFRRRPASRAGCPHRWKGRLPQQRRHRGGFGRTGRGKRLEVDRGPRLAQDCARRIDRRWHHGFAWHGTARRRARARHAALQSRGGRRDPRQALACARSWLRHVGWRARGACRAAGDDRRDSARRASRIRLRRDADARLPDRRDLRRRPRARAHRRDKTRFGLVACAFHAARGRRDCDRPASAGRRPARLVGPVPGRHRRIHPARVAGIPGRSCHRDAEDRHCNASSAAAVSLASDG